MADCQAGCAEGLAGVGCSCDAYHEMVEEACTRPRPFYEERYCQIAARRMAQEPLFAAITPPAEPEGQRTLL